MAENNDILYYDKDFNDLLRVYGDTPYSDKTVVKRIYYNEKLGKLFTRIFGRIYSVIFIKKDDWYELCEDIGKFKKGCIRKRGKAK